jgi:hypothetical protein
MYVFWEKTDCGGAIAPTPARRTFFELIRPRVADQPFSELSNTLCAKRSFVLRGSKLTARFDPQTATLQINQDCEWHDSIPQFNARNPISGRLIHASGSEPISLPRPVSRKAEVYEIYLGLRPSSHGALAYRRQFSPSG